MKAGSSAFLLALALAAATRAGASPAEDVARAERAFREGRFAEAADAYAAVARALRSPAAYANLGLALGRLERWEEAAGAYGEAVRAGGDPDGSLRLHRAHCWIEARRWDEAQADLEAIRALPARAREAEERLALLYWRRGDLPAATRAYAALARRDPGRSDLFLAWSRCALAQGEYAEAAAALDLARRLGGESVGLARQLGDVCWRAGMPVEAAAAYEQAAAAPGATADDWFRLGEARERCGENRSARLALERALALDPGHLGARVHLASLLAACGDGERARAEYRAAAVAHPASVVPWLALAELEWNGGRMAAAAAAFDEAVRRGERGVAALYNRVVAHRAAGDSQAAVAALREALANHPREPALRELARRP